MKTSVATFLIALLGFLVVQVSPLIGATTATADTAKVKKIPFHGTLQSVDTSAATVTLKSAKDAGGRVFHVESDTKITDGAGNATTLSSAVVGEDVGGSYTKDASGNMNLNSLRLGAKSGSKETKETAAAPAKSSTPTPAPVPAATTTAPPAAAGASSAPNGGANTTSSKEKKERFSGTVVSVDASGGTMVVHGKADQTFTVTSTTKISGAANLGAVTAGAKVSGSYVKSADGGVLTVTTLKVTK